MADESLPTFVTGSGEIFRPVDAAQAEDLRQSGLKEATTDDFRHEELRKQYSSWMYAPIAAGLGALHTAAPGATGAALSAVDSLSHNVGLAASDVFEGLQAGQAKPYAGGELAGALVQGPVNAAAEALTGPGGAAAVGAASFMGMTFDDLALKHIRSPEGAEKTAAALAKSGAMGAGLGLLGFGVAGAIAKRSLKTYGVKLEEAGEAALRKETAVGNAGVQARLEEKNAVEATNELIEKYDLLGKGKPGVEQRLKSIKQRAEKAMQEAKHVTTETLPLEEQVSYARKLQQVIGDTPHFKTTLGEAFAKPQSVSELHALRTELDDLINWGERDSPLSQRMIAARDLVDNQITKTFEHAANVSTSELAQGQLARWQSANADYAAAKDLQDALHFTSATGQSLLSRIGRRLGSYAGSMSSGAFVGLLSGSGSIGLVAAPVAWMIGKTMQKSGPAAARTILGAGKMMQAFDGSLLRAVLGSSVSETLPRLTGAAALLGLADYTPTAAVLQHATENPAETVQNMAQNLADKKVPGDIIDTVVPQNVRAMQYLQSQLPKSPWTNQTVAPIPWCPALKEQTLFLEKANAVLDPLSALESPTPAKMEALQSVYPITRQKVALLASQYAATQPDLSRKERIRLAVLAGMPAFPLASPFSQAIMAQVNAAAQQQLAQGPSHPQRRGAPEGTMVHPDLSSFFNNQLGRMARNG